MRKHLARQQRRRWRWRRYARDVSKITEVAITAALEAGAIAFEGFRAADLEIDIKADKHDLVTRYDRACEAHIRRVILEAFADSSIVGEEDGAHVGTGALTWYVDPIDGTANFASGIALWAVSIGVARDGEMIAGVIYDPVSGQLFWSDERGAFLREQFGQGEDRPMRSRGHADAGEATVALNFPLARDLVHFEALALAQYAEITREFGQVRGLHSTCIALAWVAAGWVDATISFETSPWDVTAGCYIIRRAGGSFLGYLDGAPVAEGESHLSPHYYAVGSGADYELLREVMRTQSLRPVA